MDKPESRISVILESNFEAHRRHLGIPNPMFFADVIVIFYTEFSLAVNFLRIRRLL